MNNIRKVFDPINVNTQTWREIFNQYDTQFNELLYIIYQLGDTRNVDVFKYGTDKVLTLSNEYTRGKNELMVYKNNVIQWVNADYKETSSTTIELVEPREYDDVIYVTYFRAIGGVNDKIYKYLAGLFMDYLNNPDVTLDNAFAQALREEVLKAKEDLTYAFNTYESAMNDAFEQRMAVFRAEFDALKSDTAIGRLDTKIETIAAELRKELDKKLEAEEI